MVYSFPLCLLSQLRICTFSLQYFYVLRCLLRKTLFSTYQLMSSSCLTVPVCTIKFETSLLFARQAGYVLFTIVSSDQYLFFRWITERLRINAPLCFQQPNGVWHHISRLDSQLVIFGQSFDGFHKEHEGLIISFILKALSNLRQVK